MRFAPLLLAAVLALALAAPEAAARRRHRFVRPHVYGHVLSSAPSPSPNARQPHLHTPTLTERPVLPGNTPLPAYLPNNAPPVFAPQPLP